MLNKFKFAFKKTLIIKDVEVFLHILSNELNPMRVMNKKDFVMCVRKKKCDND